MLHKVALAQQEVLFDGAEVDHELVLVHDEGQDVLRDESRQGVDRVAQRRHLTRARTKQRRRVDCAS